MSMACPRGNRCVHLEFHDVVFINYGLNPCPDCWYINVAIGTTRTIPFIQLGKTFKVPDLLMLEVASFLVGE